MAKSKKLKPVVKAKSVKELVQSAVPHVWGQIAVDVDWPCDLGGAVELCLDAGRPVMFGAMSKTEYNEVMKADFNTVNEWAAEALEGYF